MVVLQGYLEAHHTNISSEQLREDSHRRREKKIDQIDEVDASEERRETREGEASWGRQLGEKEKYATIQDIRCK